MSIENRTSLLSAAIFALLAAVTVSTAQADETAEISVDQNQTVVVQVEDAHRWGD
jgi:hypothetical protein|tara:strand:+ start:3427 stop:3591 length:165 start_codon:yes stop_codon:yes gene_type:complete